LDQVQLENIQQPDGLTAVEKRAVFSLAAIFGLRLFGLFLLLPVLAIYAATLPGSTPLYVGLALGVYGLTQAMLQIPFGLLSDRIGRKKIITIGLLIFAAGSVVAALASTIEWVIIGRAIQGGGAVSSAVLALTADLTREEQRTKAMALIGMSIGLVFLLSITIAPPLASQIGVEGLFWITSILALLAIAGLHLVVPTPRRRVTHRDVIPAREQIGDVLRNPQLLRLDFGIFVLHMVLTALFVVLPGQIIRIGELELAQHWQVYLPVMVLSVMGMLPLIIASSRSGKVTAIYRIGAAILGLGLVILALATAVERPLFSMLMLGIWVFFVGFNALEAMLPSLVSRISPAASKGTAIGVYNSLQFFGMFVGGIVAGVLAGNYGPASVFWFCAGMVALWIVVAGFAPAFTLSSSRVVFIGDQSPSQIDELIDRIGRVRGVQEVTIVRGETQAYLKVDDKELDIAALHQLNQT
jgi:MFS family permease